MKRKILCLSVIAIMLAILAAGTIAYFTAEGRAHNVITTGSINITVVEQQKGENDTTVEYPKEPITNVMPGAEISKIVTIRNDGKSTAWIRVKVDKVIELAGEVDPDFKVNTDLVKLDFYDENWIEKDGYYYYKTPVAPGESTESLFNTVTFAPTMGNEYQNCTVNITVNAEAVQTANNAIPEGGNVTNVKGWPDTTQPADTTKGE